MTNERKFLAGGALLVVVYILSSSVLAANQDFVSQGPLSVDKALVDSPPPGGVPLKDALATCFPKQDSNYRYKLVGGDVSGHQLYACYQISRQTGSVFAAKVLDARTGEFEQDLGLIKSSGAWTSIGLVKSRGELILGGFGLATVIWTFWTYYRRLRPGHPRNTAWWQVHRLLVALGVTVVGLLYILVVPGVSRARKVRVGFQSLIVFAGILLTGMWINASSYLDSWAITVMTLLSAAYIYGLLGGKKLLMPEGFGLPEDVLLGTADESSGEQGPPQMRPPGKPSTRAAEVSGSVIRATSDRYYLVKSPSELPTFKDVGGMKPLKEELKDTFGLVLAFAEEAQTYRITWNGILLHGPPGVGKTFLAKAVAGEYGLNFIHLSAGDLISPYAGESPRKIAEAFRFASQKIPSILFFDEFDSLAQRRDDFPDREGRRVVNQLLQSLEEWRKVKDLIVVAATNSIDDLDEAVIRPGRFDRQIRIDLPDGEARQAIFSVLLKDRPAVTDLNLAELALRSEGLTPAAISRAVEAASLTAFREATESGEMVHITMAHLIAGLDERGGKDRPTVEDWTWEKLVLPSSTKQELIQLQKLVEDPTRAEAFGVAPPSGVLLTGPPGTGKTTIAKVLAAQAKCSFYAVSSATVTSKWVGESEKKLQQLFRRARENRPSIIFIDEIDSIASVRGEWGTYDRQTNQLLTEMDGMGGQRGVLVIAATNRPDQLDPALLRGGRLSRIIEIPLPDCACRMQLFEIYSDKMPLVGVNLETLSVKTAGMSGAGIKALCQQAALQAMVRGGEGSPHVTEIDFVAALKAETRETTLKRREEGNI